MSEGYDTAGTLDTDVNAWHLDRNVAAGRGSSVPAAGKGIMRQAQSVGMQPFNKAFTHSVRECAGGCYALVTKDTTPRVVSTTA